MDTAEIINRLEEVAESVAVTDYTIVEHRERTHLEWVGDDGLEREVAIRDADTNLVVEFDVWYDNYDTYERSWYSEEIASVNPDYPTVLMPAIQRAFEKAFTIEDSDLAFVDGSPPEESEKRP